MTLTEAALVALIARAFERHGMSPPNAALVAAVVAAAERDGAASHGLLRLDGYIATLRSGWVDGAAAPVVAQPAPAILAVDARNGFAQVALAAVRDQAMAVARSQGLAAVCIADSHHFAALWPDVEPFAEQGFIALTVVNTRSRIVAWGGRRKVLGTNPMAFACPRGDGPPVVWDQASSQRAQGEVLKARIEGRPVPEGVGLDAAGEPTTDPASILDGGALLPFGGHKGAGIAFMIEVLAAAMTGGRFGFQDDSPAFPGAQTSRAGQFLLVIDPARGPGGDVPGRIASLVSMLREAGAQRMPGDERRHRRAQSLRDGISIPDAAHAKLVALAGDTQ
ncbi:Ldh family oxidoreductase [Roseomonas sp. CAU 1739]|uniref:Ldh family oxidoreductase n=1 Tax=Roseomonas sp. CAU 1739 TaxID=3140364 RepID=UPI00325B89A8